MRSSTTFHVGAVRGLHRDRVNAPLSSLCLSEHAVARRCERHQHDIVLILPQGVLALAIEHPDDRQRNLANANDLVNGIEVAEQLPRRGLTDQRHFPRARQLGWLEQPARRQRPIARDQVIIVGAEVLRGPIGVSSRHLARSAYRWSGDHDAFDIHRDCQRIFLGQRLCGTRAEANAAGSGRAGKDQHQIRAEILQLLANALLRSAADRQHRDHRGDTNDHAEHGQARSQLVDAQSL